MPWGVGSALLTPGGPVFGAGESNAPTPTLGGPVGSWGPTGDPLGEAVGLGQPHEGPQVQPVPVGRGGAALLSVGRCPGSALTEGGGEGGRDPNPTVNHSGPSGILGKKKRRLLFLLRTMFGGATKLAKWVLSDTGPTAGDQRTNKKKAGQASEYGGLRLDNTPGPSPCRLEIGSGITQLQKSLKNGLGG